MTIIKEFTKDMDTEWLIEWYRDHDNCTLFHHVIKHFETKLQMQEERIKNLENDKSKIKSELEQPQFKVGWVYENGVGKCILIVSIFEHPNTFYPLIGINLDETPDAADFIRYTFTLSGINDLDAPYAKSNLIHSTGHKWEIEE